MNRSPKGEPRLGKRGLYGAVGGMSPAEREHAMLWVLNQSDGAAAAESVKETDIDLPTGSLIEDDVVGKWVAKDSSKAVVVGFVTARTGVAETTVDDYLHYGTADIAGALIFMDL